MSYRVATRPTGICPVCDRPLRRLLVIGHTYERCGQCEGLWVDHDTIDALCSDMSVGAAFPAYEPSPATESIRQCPRCCQDMAKVLVRPERHNAGPKTVLLDRCAQHGIWFDRNELSSVLADVAWPESAFARLVSLIRNALVA